MSTLRLDRRELERARNASGISTDSELADRLGLHKGTVSRLLSGQSEPSARFIAALLERLPTRFDDLFEIVPDHKEAA